MTILRFVALWTAVSVPVSLGAGMMLARGSAPSRRPVSVPVLQPV